MAEKVAEPTNPPQLRQDPKPSTWTWRKWHVWVLVIGFMFRCAFCASVDKESSFGGWDGKEYHAYAQSLLAHKWDDYPRYFNNVRPPFYPIFLMPFVALNSQVVWHIQLVQSLLGILTAFVLATIAGRWAGQRVGDWALVLALFYPFLIYQSAFVLTETVFIFLLWFGIASLQRLDEPRVERQMRWLVAGALALGLGCLTRPALQLFLVVAVSWVGWRAWRNGNWSIALKRTVLFTVVVSSTLLPCMIVNYSAHGELSLAPGGAQTAFAFSNSPEYLKMYEAKTKAEYYEHFEIAVARLSINSGTSREAWIEVSRDFRQNHKRDWWRLQWYKFKHFWTPWVNPMIFSRGQFMLSLFSTTPLFLMAAVELWRRRRQRDPFSMLLLGLVGVGYLVAGFLFHVQVRYRIPFVDGTFLLLSASLLGQFDFKRLYERAPRERQVAVPI